jgi:predicted TIM-barrel fold metal-dependent hydrolase
MTSHRIFDADVHHQYASTAALAPYMPDGDASGIYMPRSGGGSPRGGMRRDAMPPNGGIAGSVPEFVVENHLERYGIDYALLNPGSPLALGGIPFLDLAADLASATNEWTIQEWFPVDERFLGSILVAPRDPDRAADEIRRHGAHPRMVQVTLTSAPTLLGDRFMHPIFEAANEFGLPVNLHVGGGNQGVSPGDHPGGSTWPTSFLQLHIGMCIPGLYHLISMVSEGVFEKYPRIRFIVNEFGVSWLPFVMWRMDMEYRAAREDVPWLTRLPSAYIRDFVRFTTQPLESPEDPQRMVKLLGLVDAQDMLVFSSDYPHWDFDSPEFALKGFPEEWKRRIYWDNASELFHLERRLGIPPEPALS